MGTLSANSNAGMTRLGLLANGFSIDLEIVNPSALDAESPMLFRWPGWFSSPATHFQALKQELLSFMARSSVHVAYCFVLTNVCCGLMVGCGPSAPVRNYAEVTGTVKYQTKPAANAEIVFQPAAGAPVVGKIGPDGTYTIQGVIGPNTVMINNPKPPPPAATADIAKNKSAMADYEKAIKEAKIVPDKYAGTQSGLTFDVKAGKNKADFDLQ